MNNNKKSAREETQESVNKKQAFKEGNMDNTGKINQPIAAGKIKSSEKIPQQDKPAGRKGI